MAVSTIDTSEISSLCSLLIITGDNQPSVLLSNVQTLTLQKGQRTRARRVSSIPQLKCVGGSGKCAFEPDVVQCYNRGSNGIDIQVGYIDFHVTLNDNNDRYCLVGM
jgi:hypothetical protein